MAALIAALTLAAVSGSFYIVGLTSILAAAYRPIIGMGVGFEGGELAAVTGTASSTSPTSLEVYLSRTDKAFGSAP